MDKDAVEDNEEISRYLFDKTAIRSSNNTVRHNAFMPPTKSYRLSVYRTNNLASEEIWEIGNEYVAKVRGKPLVGRGSLTANVVIINPAIN